MANILRVKGLDTSHWSGLFSSTQPINFQMMYDQNVRFWITKATDSWVYTPHLYVDEYFHKYCGEAFKATCPIKLRGCYHWLQWSVDPVVQADWYIEQAYSKYPFEIMPVLDFEEASVYKDKQNFSDYAWRAQVWLERVYELTGRLPMVYTAQWFLDYFPDKKKLEFLSRYPLWLADYSWRTKITDKPYYLASYVWPEGPSVWQKTDKGDGKAYGLNAASADVNDFMLGDYEALLKFFGVEVTPPPGPSYKERLAALVKEIKRRRKLHSNAVYAEPY